MQFIRSVNLLTYNNLNKKCIIFNLKQIEIILLCVRCLHFSNQTNMPTDVGTDEPKHIVYFSMVLKCCV
jgi:hypothetical protein